MKTSQLIVGLALGLASQLFVRAELITIQANGALSVHSPTFVGEPLSAGEPFSLSFTFDPEQFQAGGTSPYFDGTFAAYKTIGTGEVKVGGVDITSTGGEMTLLISDAVATHHDSLTLHYAGDYGANEQLVLDINLVSTSYNALYTSEVPDFTALAYADATTWDMVDLLHFGVPSEGVGYGPIQSANVEVSASTPVPEPSTYGLLASVLLVFGAWSRRRITSQRSSMR